MIHGGQEGGFGAGEQAHSVAAQQAAVNAAATMHRLPIIGTSPFKATAARGDSPSRFRAGEYQGLVTIRSTGTSVQTVVPYWYGVPSNIPDKATLLSILPTQLPPGQTANLFFDAAGLPVSNRQALNYSGTAVQRSPAGARSVAASSFANLPPLVFDVEGVRP